MSHRVLVLAALVVGSSAAACAAPATAPTERTLAPGAASRAMYESTLCRSGWVNSEGRCL